MCDDDQPLIRGAAQCVQHYGSNFQPWYQGVVYVGDRVVFSTRHAQYDSVTVAAQAALDEFSTALAKILEVAR